MEILVTCPNCGKRITAEVHKDELGEYAYCGECDSTFDV